MDKKDFDNPPSKESFFSKAGYGDDRRESSPSEQKEEAAEMAEFAETVLTDENRHRAAYVQLQADFENFKKRSSKEREELAKVATRDLIEELLTIMDHLDFALQSVQPDDEKGRQITQGFAMIISQFKKLLANRGLAEVGKIGEFFNPKYHEAVGQTSHQTIPVDHICQLVRIGYQLHGIVLRPASVIVSSGLPTSEPKEGSL
ncbi:MAG: nucleotide exchange factor GrpE [Puniceicoccales bacterium]|jgi:molecular chaperone GrpE|nr:nucleotide exchange factor GrpE [Puniceicoccales bacterium]